jgi:chromosome segregation ATPase
VLSSAFAQTPSEPDQCHQPVNANAIIDRLRGDIGPNTGQVSSLQRLGQAIDTGADRLAKSCPTEIPHEPTARLQLMLRQIEALTTAIDLIRQPLDDFEESLTQEQRARLAAAATSGAAASVHSCGSSPAEVDRSVEQIEKSVQPSETQRAGLDELHQALSRAANDLNARCSAPVPQSAGARLDALEARLDATWNAVLSIQAGLYNFDTQLSADQKNRLRTMTFAAQD